MKKCYVPRKFNAEHQDIVDRANQILTAFAAQGYDLTLRQLYYQFVSRDWFPEGWKDKVTGSTNNVQSYKKLGDIVSAARRAGLIDWDHIVDRTRNVRVPPAWDGPESIVRACAGQFAVDFWADQAYRPECFPPDTPVVTRHGVVLIGSVRIGDQVLTQSGRFRPVEKVIETRYSGDLLDITATGVPSFRVTPNHPIWCRAYDATRPGLKGAERKFQPDAFVASQAVKPFDMLFVPRIQHEQDVASVGTQAGPRSHDIGDIRLDESFLAVVGLYLAEGSVRPDERTVQFTFHADEEYEASLVAAWARTYHLKPHTAFGAGTRIVYLFSKPLADLLAADFGNGAFHKRLPDWCLHLPREKQLKILEFYFRGDGSLWDEYRGSFVATSRSQTLIQQVQLVLVRNGFACNQTVTQDHGEPRYQISVCGESVCRLAAFWGHKLPDRVRRYNHNRMDDSGMWCPVRSVRSVPYSGTVYNLEVAEDHTYCVPVSVHNCWVEKDALVGVLEVACEPWHCPYFSCRGYTSDSEIWAAAQRLAGYGKKGQTPIVFHLGDHDPSGVDMTRDIFDRVKLFASGYAHDIEVRRLALTMAQVEEYHPPPNPAKTTDARYKKYEQLHGDESWELDALEPATITALIAEHMTGLVDATAWAATEARQAEGRRLLTAIADDWDAVTDGL